MSDYRHWTSDEEKYIQDHWRLQTDGEMAAALNRSEGAVRTKRRELRCSPQKTWTPEELQYLEDHWGTVSIPGIAKKLGRTVNAIKVRVARMGLGGMLNSGDYVTFNQLMRELTDMRRLRFLYRVSANTPPILPDVRRGVPGTQRTDLLPEVPGHAEETSPKEIRRAPRSGPVLTIYL